MTFTWSKVRDVVDAVLDLPPEQRSRYLDNACPEPALRQYVDSLVLSYDRAGSFLQTPATPVQNLWAATAQDEESWVGRRLGPYEVIAEIGHGGMGAVYRAIRADDQYQKQVAIKIVRGGFESGFALSRFRAERQILANLEHPNIARLLDGGTTQSGIPYLVMELVEGQPIDLYCDSHRLAIRERLSLFRTICSAVTYAHQNLIVHRDLKPGNIFITKEGVPKLLDFGIAKILSQESTSREAEPSVAMLRILTPEYASPEQITGSAVSTATDVYSLGVVLYLLLTGHRPYSVDPQHHDEMMRTICQQEPVKPSAKVREGIAISGSDGLPQISAEQLADARGSKPERIRRQLAGDLDNIVLKALRKEPDRRYVSVEQFSEDIRRHLDGLPITARKETFSYMAQKFVTRNKWAVTAIVLLILSLSAGLLATLHEARIARAQQAKADRRFQDVRALANSLMFEVHDGIVNLPGSTPVRKLIIERALKYLDGLNQDAKGDQSLEMELAMAYDKVGDVQGQPMEANLGDPAAAIASYEKALALRESVAAEDPKNIKVQHDLVYSYIRLSDLLGYRGESARGLTYARREIPTAERLLEQDPGNDQNRVMLAGCHVDQGFKEAMSGDAANGLATLQRGAEMLDQWLSTHPADGSVRRMLAITYGRIGDIQRDYLKNGGDAIALASFRKAASTLQPLLAQEPNNAEIRRILTYDQRSAGELLDDMNREPEALALEREALASLQKLAAADPANAQLRGDIGVVHSRIGRILTEVGNPDEAIREQEQAIAAFAKSKDADVPESYYGFRLLLAQLWLGKAHVALASSKTMNPGQRRQHCREAQSLFQRCIPPFESLRNKGPGYDAESALKEIAGDTSRCIVPDE